MIKPWEHGYFLTIEPVAVSDALRQCKDEIKRSHAQRDELLAVLTEYIAAADNFTTGIDDVSAMLRLGEADSAARVAITKASA